MNSVKICDLPQFIALDEIVIEIFQANWFEDTVGVGCLKQEKIICFGNWDLTEKLIRLQQTVKLLIERLWYRD